VQDWVERAVALLIKASDDGARSAALYATALRRLEVPDAPRYTPRAATGRVDQGVSSPLLLAGPYDFMNRLAEFQAAPPQGVTIEQAKKELKEVTADKVAAESIRYAQMGARQTTFDVSQEDAVALGWVRVTSADPCWFCAMLASRGLQYRPYKEGAFERSNERFEGSGNAKVHDSCRCHLKPVYFETDKRVLKTKEYAEMWSAFTSGESSGKENLNNFRVGYNHLMKTGEMLSIEQILKRRGVA
jgi:hypothetical protein